jgi:hypothetical protein
VIRAHQPGSEPIDIPETIPNPVVVPKPTPSPTEPAPKEPVRIPEKIPLSGVSTANWLLFDICGPFCTAALRHGHRHPDVCALAPRCRCRRVRSGSVPWVLTQ